MRCPKDGSACCDDMCHGAGCLQMDGYAMLAECDVCGGLIDEEIPDCSTCTCDPDYDDCPDQDHEDYAPSKQQATPELQKVLADALSSTPNVV